MRYPILNLLSNRLSTLIYFVTLRCNANCQMCYNYGRLNKGVSDELTTSEIKSICAKLKKLTLLQCSGGEPFLKENLFEILNAFAAISAAITVPTNAFLPKRIENITSRLVSQNKNTLFRIAISIDGLGELHNQIRNYSGGFALLMDTFYRLKKIQAKHHNLLLTCNTVFSKLNEDVVNNIIDFVYDLGVDAHTITHMWGNPKDAQSLAAPIESYQRVLSYSHCKNYMHKRSTLPKRVMQTINKLSDITMLEILQKKRMVYRCQALRKFAIMWQNGDIVPCHFIEKNLGNLRDNGYNLDRILKNNKASKLLRDIHNKKCWCRIKCCNRNNVVYNIKTAFYLIRYWQDLIR